GQTCYELAKQAILEFMQSKAAAASKDEVAVVFYNTTEMLNDLHLPHVYVLVARSQPSVDNIRKLLELSAHDFMNDIGSLQAGEGQQQQEAVAKSAAEALHAALWTAHVCLQGGRQHVLDRARPLHDLQISCRFFPLVAAVRPFDSTLFWDDLLALLPDPEDETGAPGHQEEGQLPSGALKQECFTLVAEASRPLVVKLTRDTLEPVKADTALVNQADGTLVRQVAAKAFVAHGSKTCPSDRFPKVTHSSFLRPKEQAVGGSTAGFKALLDALQETGRFALCRCVKSKAALPTLVALLPQPEILNPAGIQVTFADSLQVAVAAQLVAAWTLPYTTGGISNPSLQRHFDVLQHLALYKEPPNEEEVEDGTLGRPVTDPQVLSALARFQAEVLDPLASLPSPGELW
ncbi:X-ray repair cross complementing 6, partial [Haematococcus lacustris]